MTGEDCVLGAKIVERIKGIEQRMKMQTALTKRDFVILALVVFVASLMGNGGPHLLLSVLKGITN